MTLPPPPDDLRAFYEVERSAPTLMDADTQARILDRVRIVADIAAPTAAAAAVGIGVKTMVAVAALSFTLGGVVGHVATRAVEPSEATTPVVAVSVDEPTIAAPIEEVEEVEEMEEVEQADPSPEEPIVTTERVSRQDLSRERRLLDSVSAAIARSNWSEAERALARHGRVFPRGALVEEREALRVRVAFEDGRYAAAEGLAERFLARFARSLYAPRVRRLLERARERAHGSSPAD